MLCCLLFEAFDPKPLMRKVKTSSRHLWAEKKSYSGIHISIHPSKELCSKMAPGKVGVSLP